tara:strand:+ start:1084 stop:1473 length:390 start_codon:yes stop_codon:yes gene_type:complete
MTDIVEKLRKYAINQHGWIDIDDTCEAAADEIERLREAVMNLCVSNGKLSDENEELRGIIQQAADDVVAASYPRKMHLEWLEAARKALAEDDHIASADCWCKPTELEEGIFVHNSKDRREDREEGKELQ